MVTNFNRNFKNLVRREQRCSRDPLGKRIRISSVKANLIYTDCIQFFLPIQRHERITDRFEFDRVESILRERGDLAIAHHEHCQELHVIQLALGTAAQSFAGLALIDTKTRGRLAVQHAVNSTFARIHSRRGSTGKFNSQFKTLAEGNRVPTLFKERDNNFYNPQAVTQIKVADRQGPEFERRLFAVRSTEREQFHLP